MKTRGLLQTDPKRLTGKEVMLSRRRRALSRGAVGNVRKGFNTSESSSLHFLSGVGPLSLWNHFAGSTNDQNSYSNGFWAREGIPENHRRSGA
jgi:hypothetical protein